MSLAFIRWLIPIILELFKKSNRYPGYFKRNKTIAMLFVACLLSLLLMLFMFEQASLHGINSKSHKDEANNLALRINQCQVENSGLIASCGGAK